MENNFTAPEINIYEEVSKPWAAHAPVLWSLLVAAGDPESGCQRARRADGGRTSSGPPCSLPDPALLLPASSTAPLLLPPLLLPGLNDFVLSASR